MERAATLTGYILSGRPVLRDASAQPFYSEDNVFRLSYWTAEEVSQLKLTFDSLSESHLRDLDPDWGALPSTQEATNAAFNRKSGLIITVA